MNQIKLLKSAIMIAACLTIMGTLLAAPSAMTKDQTSLYHDLKNPPTDSVATILESYVADFRKDQFAEQAMLFGIEVEDKGSWTVHITGKKVDDAWEVLLNKGLPKTPTFVYVITYKTLLGIHQGKLNAITAQGKAFSSDYSPMDIRYMEAYQPTQEEEDKINPFSFHFWTRGFPETIPFGAGMTREAHGADVVFFYYQKGFRSGWLRIQPKGKVRYDPREQAMPFPMLVIALKGTTVGEMNGQPVSLSEGNALFIPPGTTHKWWNETDEPTEAILVMFGEGA